MLPTCDDPSTISSLCTYLFLSQAHSKAVKSAMTSFLKLRSSYFADRRRLPKALSVSRQIKRLAHRLHSYSHFPAADLEPLCRSGVILTLHLSQSIRYVTRHSQSCAIAGRPRCSRTVPLAKVLCSFNEKIMLDFSNAGTHGTPYFKDSRYG